MTRMTAISKPSAASNRPVVHQEGVFVTTMSLGFLTTAISSLIFGKMLFGRHFSVSRTAMAVMSTSDPTERPSGRVVSLLMSTGKV